MGCPALFLERLLKGFELSCDRGELLGGGIGGLASPLSASLERSELLFEVKAFGLGPHERFFGTLSLSGSTNGGGLRLLQGSLELLDAAKPGEHAGFCALGPSVQHHLSAWEDDISLRCGETHSDSVLCMGAERLFQAGAEDDIPQ